MQIRNYRLLLAIIVGLFAYGVQMNPVSASESDYSINSGIPKATLVIGSDRLRGRIDIGNSRFRSVGQLTQAQVMVQNMTETRYTLEYKFDWEDNQGFQVDSLNSWHRFTLTAGEARTFTSTGKVPDAKNIMFTVRLPDDAFIESEKQEKIQEIHDTTEPTQDERR